MTRFKYWLISAATTSLLVGPAFAQGASDQQKTPGLSADQEMSDRTPSKETSSPASQTTKVEGETSDRTPSNHDMQRDAAAGQQGAAQSARGGQNTGRPVAMSQSGIKESLQKAGFKEVRIVDAAYLVHAKNSDGDTIIMTINPPSVAGDNAMTGSGAGTSGSSSEGAQQSN